MQLDTRWGQAIRGAFGHQVRVKRAAQSVSQEELALKCGLDRSYIGQVERGERNLSLENIYRIAAGLGIPAKDLMSELEGSLDLHPLEGTQ